VVRALTHGRGIHRHWSARVTVLAFVVSGVCVGALVAAAGTARADGSWTSTSGSFTMTSSPGDCQGSGTGSISLVATGGNLQGTISETLDSISPICSGDFASVSGDPIYGTMYSDGAGFSATDSGGDQFQGWYNSSGQLEVQLVPGGSSGGGGQCSEFCDTLYFFTFTGTGDLFTVSNPAFDFSSPAPLAALFGGLFGMVGIAQGAASARRVPTPPRPPSAGTVDLTPAPGTAPPPGAFAPNTNPNAVMLGDRWTATPGDARTPDVAPSPIQLDAATSIPLSGGGAFVAPPEYYTIPGGQPPPNSETDPRSGKLLCPVHQIPVHPQWISYGPARPFLRWQCPVGPHLPWG